MRRGFLLVVGLIAILPMLPEPADARPRSLPGALFGALTRPLGAVLGATRRVTRPRAAVQIRERRIRAAQQRRATAARAAAAATAGTAAVAVVSTSSVPTQAVPLPVPAPPRPVARAEEPLKAVELTPTPLPPPPVVEPAAPVASASPSPSVNAFEDVVGFVLWPDRYGERLRGRGIADVTGAIFVSQSTGVASICTDIDGLDPNWPTRQIADAINPTDDQRRHIERLRAAFGAAIDAVKRTCRAQADKSPIERVRVMQAMLTSMRDGAVSIRAPLVTLFESLNDKQKRSFIASRTTGSGSAARVCASPSRELPLQKIERDLQPTEAQRASLQSLQRKSFEMDQFLMASCLQSVPATPIERLDMAVDRLTAVMFAASNIGLALNQFYGQLGDVQKRKFDEFGM